MYSSFTRVISGHCLPARYHPEPIKNALKRHSSTVPHIFGIRYHLISEKPRVKVNLKMTLRPTFSSPIFVFEFLLIH